MFLHILLDTNSLLLFRFKKLKEYSILYRIFSYYIKEVYQCIAILFYKFIFIKFYIINVLGYLFL